jgi:SH3-like domain-containing protein
LSFRKHHWLLVAGILICISLAGCKGKGKDQEIAYVSAPQVFLRDRVAAVYDKVGTVKNGDRVQILDRDRRFVKVRTSAGLEGWMEQRNLITQQVYDKLQQLSQREKDDPIQATGVTRNDTNLHVEPGRDTDHLYQISEGSKVQMLKRATVQKAGAAAPPSKPSLPKQSDKEPPKPAMEDWWLVRDQDNHMGWVLGRMIDIDVPLEIAQYAEGQRIIASFVLDQVSDGDKKVPEYLVVLSEPKDGLPYDYDQVRVFTWNVKRHRYETAYRERNLAGVLPVTVTKDNFDKEGTLPVFILRVRDDSGNISEKKYKLNTPIVRRVPAPGEEQARPVSRRKKR